MTNLWNLIKIEFSKSFSSTKVKENRAKSYSFFAIVILVIILGIGLSSLYTFIYGNVFLEAGASLDPLVLIFATVASMLTLFSGINQARGIFIGKDYDMLSALPLKKAEIIASKVINLLLVELLYSSIILIPNGVVISLLTGDWFYLGNSFILAIFISFFPLVISLIFSFLTALISDRFKYGNFVAMALYILLFGGLMVFSFMISKSTSVEEQSNVIINMSGVIKWINPLTVFVELSLTDNYLFILAFIGINVVSLVVVILVFSLFFDKLHETISAMKSDYKYERKELKIKNELKALLGLEFRRLINSKMYFMNSIVGLIMTLIMTVFLGLTFSKYSPFGVNETIIGYVHDYAFIGGTIVVFGLGITSPSAVGISMEGKNFWLVKTLPMNYKKYMWSKLLLSLILMVPVSLIASTIIVVFIQPDILSIVSLYVIPLLFVFFEVVLALLINLTFYKLRWSNEQEVVKSSSSVVLVMLIDFGLLIVMSGILAGVGIFIKPLGIFLTIGLLAVASIIVYAILSHTFERKINNIENF